MRPSWDEWLLEMARFTAGRSRDPSTQVGAVIARADHTIASIGFNGFPRGVWDRPERLEDRALKYELTVHAELNAILHAREDLRYCTLYVWPLMPCARCAGAIIQAGIKRVVAPRSIPDRWTQSCGIARQMFQEAGVTLDVA